MPGWHLYISEWAPAAKRWREKTKVVQHRGHWGRVYKLYWDALIGHFSGTLLVFVFMCDDRQHTLSPIVSMIMTFEKFFSSCLFAEFTAMIWNLIKFWKGSYEKEYLYSNTNTHTNIRKTQKVDNIYIKFFGPSTKCHGNRNTVGHTVVAIWVEWPDTAMAGRAYHQQIYLWFLAFVFFFNRKFRRKAIKLRVFEYPYPNMKVHTLHYYHI